MATVFLVAGMVVIVGAYALPVAPSQQTVVSLPGIGLIAGGLPFYRLHWKRLDEAKREAHKFAWFYGGTGAFFVLVFCVSFAIGLRAGLSGQGFFEALDHAMRNPYVIGGATVFAVQSIGYLGAWLFWWRLRR